MKRNLSVRLRVTGIILAILSPALLPRPASGADPIAPGQILVATTRIKDPEFRETVVLLVKTGAGGVAGVILNRPSETPLSRVFPSAKDRGAIIYLGGPLPFGARALVRSKSPPSGAEIIVPGVHTISSESALNRLVETDSVFRVYAGYAGWTEEQLDGEVTGGFWIRKEGRAEIIFDPHPETLWERSGGGSILKTALTPRLPAIR